MYVEPPAMTGGQTEDGNIGVDAEIEVDEEEAADFWEGSEVVQSCSAPPPAGRWPRQKASLSFFPETRTEKLDEHWDEVQEQMKKWG